MIFWIRELLGWLLVLAGLEQLYHASAVLLRDGPFLLEGPAVAAIGFIIFRGGLQVLKVSVAGRVCLQAQQAALAETHRSTAGLRKKPPRAEVSA